MTFETISTKGPRSARVMLVGEAPGKDELEKGIPFVGASGKILDEVMLKVGLDPANCFFTNLCRHRPPDNEIFRFFDKKGFPNDKVIDGLKLLKKDIDEIQPNIIVALGAFPYHFLTGRGEYVAVKEKYSWSGLGSYRGYVLDGRALAAGRKVVCTYHPASTFRDHSRKHLIQFDLQRVAKQQYWPEIKRPRRRIIVESVDREAWKQWLISVPGTLSPRFQYEDSADSEWHQVPSDPFLSSDIEYIGSRLLCIGFTRNLNLAVVFPTRNASDISFIRDILLSGIPLCFQNGMFDCSILEWFYDIPCLKYLMHDTMVAMHAAYTEFPKGLDFIGSLQTEWGNCPPWWEGIDGNFWKKLSKLLERGERGLALQMMENAYHPYNGGDVCVTHEAMLSLLGDELQDPYFMNTYRHEMSLIRPLWRISTRGCRVDTQQISDLQTKLQKEADLMEFGLSHINGEPIGAFQHQKIASLLYDKLGVPTGGKTKPSSRHADGQWKMDDITLADLLLRCNNDLQRKAIRLVREARERLSLISKFCEIELDDDGRMRCHYDPAKTETGRLSSRAFYPTRRGANLQNIPRDSRVRMVFTADRGKLFAYADLKSAESMVVAHITGDPEMLRLHSEAYMSGELDGHKYVASFLLEKPIDRISKDERYLGKKCRHAGNYSLGGKHLMELINQDSETTGVSVTLSQAKRLIDRYRAFHPYLQQWWDAVLADLWATHTVYTQHKRKRVFYGHPNTVLPVAIAYNPQGTIAQTLNMGLSRLDRDYYEVPHESWQAQYDQAVNMMQYTENAIKSRLVNELGYEMLLQVHDAIGFQFPEANADKILPIVKELMSIPIEIKRRGIDPYTITIPVDIKVGLNWGEFDPKKPEENPNGLKTWNG